MEISNTDCPLIMGVVNITPDSFYPLSRIEPTKRVDTAIDDQYADIIDDYSISTFFTTKFTTKYSP